MNTFLHRAIRLAIVTLTAGAALLHVTGCKSGPTLVAAPNLYADDPESHPYANVPSQLQTSSATIIYATDRQPEEVEGVYGYSAKRSRETRFGLCTVQMGVPGTTWEQLVQASTSHERTGEWPLALTSIDERGSYPNLGPPVEIDGQWVDDPTYVENCKQRTEQLHELISKQLAKTSRKEVYVFVHGYNNSFASGAFRTAQLWHYLGRGGVGILYSWPAGSTGLLRGYNRDRESGEFTNPHLKQFIRAIASCPDVQEVNLIAHSRGTDILATAVRELRIEDRGGGKDTRAQLKLGQIVLAAPDIDLDVFIERFSADRVGLVPERLTIYTSPHDKAIGLSDWLFSSTRRIGSLAMGDLGDDLAPMAKSHPVMTIVEMRAKSDRKGHGYFLSSPACLSDVILVLRDNRAPGAANGRPLLDEPDQFWELPNGYPFHDQPIKDK